MPPSVATRGTEYRSPDFALLVDYAGTCSGDYRFPDENGEGGRASACPVQWAGRTYTVLDQFHVPDLAPARGTEPFVPALRARTPLGRRLLEIRSRIVASGFRLRNWDDIDRELAERRDRTE